MHYEYLLAVVEDEERRIGGELAVACLHDHIAELHYLNYYFKLLACFIIVGQKDIRRMCVSLTWNDGEDGEGY